MKAASLASNSSVPMARFLARPSLAARLDAVLLTLPAIRSAGLDPALEALAAMKGLAGPGEFVVRRVALTDGRVLAVAAVPSAGRRGPEDRAAVRAIRLATKRIGRRILLVTEAVLDRESRLANALLVAECAAAAVAPRDRIALLAGLVEAGGAMGLADAAEFMTLSEDRVAAVLAFVASRVLAIDTSHPVGPDTAVATAGRWGGR